MTRRKDHANWTWKLQIASYFIPCEHVNVWSIDSLTRKRATAGVRRRAMAGAGWSVYLVVSTQLPRSYVGVTTHFPRRLKQHNGELKGGAKACRAGRPWTCACIIHGFKDQSEACEFEWKWKRLSRKLQRRKTAGVEEKHGVYEGILGNRELALKKVRDSCPSSHLEVDWKITSQTYRISTC